MLWRSRCGQYKNLPACDSRQERLTFELWRRQVPFPLDRVGPAQNKAWRVQYAELDSWAQAEWPFQIVGERHHSSFVPGKMSRGTYGERWTTGPALELFEDWFRPPGKHPHVVAAGPCSQRLLNYWEPNR